MHAVARRTMGSLRIRVAKKRRNGMCKRQLRLNVSIGNSLVLCLQREQTMKLRLPLLLLSLCVSHSAISADTTDRTSPVDRNAACMDRTVDSSTGNCVVQQEGTPRRTYPPRPATPAPTP